MFNISRFVVRPTRVRFRETGCGSRGMRLVFPHTEHVAFVAGLCTHKRYVSYLTDCKSRPRRLANIHAASPRDLHSSCPGRAQPARELLTRGGPPGSRRSISEFSSRRLHASGISRLPLDTPQETDAPAGPGTFTKNRRRNRALGNGFIVLARSWAPLIRFPGFRNFTTPPAADHHVAGLIRPLRTLLRPVFHVGRACDCKLRGMAFAREWYFPVCSRDFPRRNTYIFTIAIKNFRQCYGNAYLGYKAWVESFRPMISIIAANLFVRPMY